MEQHTNEWYKARLGKITGSAVSKIFGSSRKKDEKFGDTAKTYLYQIAAERLMNQQYLDIEDLFDYYLEQTNVSTKDMRWGNDQEPFARALYEKLAIQDCYMRLEETGSVQDKERPFFASSPDGLVYIDGEVAGCIEIKCPNQGTYMRYRTEITNAASLKAVKPEYYWQVLSHMMVTGATWCDFVAYCPWQKDPLYVVRICLMNGVKDDIEVLKARLDEAEAFLTEIGAAWAAPRTAQEEGRKMSGNEETPAMKDEDREEAPATKGEVREEAPATKGEGREEAKSEEAAATEDAEEPPFPEGLREWAARGELKPSRRRDRASSYAKHIEDE